MSRFRKESAKAGAFVAHSCSSGEGGCTAPRAEWQADCQGFDRLLTPGEVTAVE